MDSLFFLKLILSFVIGGLWVIVSTVLAERFGSRIGGFVAGLPTTVLVGLFFIGWTQSPLAAAQATTPAPAVGGINCLFITTYVLLVRRSFAAALVGALLVWCLLALFIIKGGLNDFALSLVLYGILLFASYHVIDRLVGVRSEAGKSVSPTAMALMIRGLLAGAIVVLAVLLARISGPLPGGVFSMFPATFLGTLVVTFLAHGPLFSSAVMKAAMVGTVSIVLHAVVVRYTYVPLGLWYGTVLSILISFGCASLIYRFVTSRMK